MNLFDFVPELSLPVQPLLIDSTVKTLGIWLVTSQRLLCWPKLSVLCLPVHKEVVPTSSLAWQSSQVQTPPVSPDLVRNPAGIIRARYIGHGD